MRFFSRSSEPAAEIEIRASETGDEYRAGFTHDERDFRALRKLCAVRAGYCGGIFSELEI